MSRHRFYNPTAIRQDNQVRIEGAIAHQIRRVLRLEPDDVIALFGWDEWEYAVRLDAVEPTTCLGTIVDRASPQTEPTVDLTLAVALLKTDRTEWVLQKGTELGVSRFLLMRTERTVRTPEGDRAAARLERYSRIVTEATEQCGRLRPPAVQGPVTPAQALTEASPLKLFCHEQADCSLGEAMTALQAAGAPERRTSNSERPSVLVLIGPEGGFSPTEVSHATAHGAQPVTLGPRILRAETAALAAVTLVTHTLDGGSGVQDPAGSGRQAGVCRPELLNT